MKKVLKPCDQVSQNFTIYAIVAGEVMLKYKGYHSYLYNVKTGTVPIVVHGNGPIKVGFQI